MGSLIRSPTPVLGALASRYISGNSSAVSMADIVLAASDRQPKSGAIKIPVGVDVPGFDNVSPPVVLQDVPVMLQDHVTGQICKISAASASQHASAMVCWHIYTATHHMLHFLTLHLAHM
jgi:hypothetical protein